jgi:hypothetical protein
MKALESLRIAEAAVERFLELALHVTAAEAVRLTIFQPQQTFSRMRSATEEVRSPLGMGMAAPIAISGSEPHGEFIVFSGSGLHHATVRLLAAVAGDLLVRRLEPSLTDEAEAAAAGELIDWEWQHEMERTLTPQGFLEIVRRWTELTVFYGAEIRSLEDGPALAVIAARMHETASAMGATQLAKAALTLQCAATQEIDCSSAMRHLELALAATHGALEEMHTGALWDVVCTR